MRVKNKIKVNLDGDIYIYAVVLPSASVVYIYAYK